jgi:carboxylesterase
MKERVFGIPEPFFLEGHGSLKQHMVLMIHGFTGSPAEFRRVGYFLNDLGYTVHAICLPGHGTKPEDMIRTTWIDWWGHVNDTYAFLRQQGFRQISVMGHSMGGLLAMRLALFQPVKGVISLAAPIYLQHRKAGLAVFLQHFLKYINKRPQTSPQIRAESCAYSKTPLPCVVSLNKLLRQVKISLPRLSSPLFIAQGMRDGTVRPESAHFILNQVLSKHKQIEYYPNSSHALLLDQEREKVYKDVHGFLQTI